MEIIHRKPQDSVSCLCTLEKIDDTCYVEYQSTPSLKWSISLFGEEAIRELLHSQYSNYINSLQETDCLLEFTRLIEIGPPIWISDRHGLPLPQDDTHICSLWFMNGNVYKSGKLEGALEGLARQELWEHMKSLAPLVETDKH